MTKTFSSKSNAKRAALAELGAAAIEAEDYKVTQGADGRWRRTALGKATSGADGADAAEGAATPANAPKAKDGPRKSASRANSKQAKLIAMLRGADGATVDEIAAAFGWQRHTVRGAIAGALKKKLGLAVTSEKLDQRGRVYRIAG